jgi:hypothetical protein
MHTTQWEYCTVTQLEGGGVMISGAGKVKHGSTRGTNCDHLG